MSASLVDALDKPVSQVVHDHGGESTVDSTTERKEDSRSLVLSDVVPEVASHGIDHLLLAGANRGGNLGLISGQWQDLVIDQFESVNIDNRESLLIES